MRLDGDRALISRRVGQGSHRVDRGLAEPIGRVKNPDEALDITEEPTLIAQNHYG